MFVTNLTVFDFGATMHEVNRLKVQEVMVS